MCLLLGKIKTWIAGVIGIQGTISSTGVGETLPFTLDTDVLGDQELIDKNIELSKNKGD